MRHFGTKDYGPNALITSEGELLRARARQQVRGTGQGAAARRAYKTTVVGEGIKPRSMHKTRGDEINALWKRTASTLDADGVDDFYGMQETVASADFADGEVFLRKRPRRAEDGLPVALQVQVIEADMLPLQDMALTSRQAGPLDDLVGGIEVDALGRRAAYHFYKRHPRDAVGFRSMAAAVETRRVPASEVLHIFHRWRPGQMRGETALAPVIEAIWQVAQYSISEMDRAGFASRLNLFIEQGAAGDTNPFGAYGEAAPGEEGGAANPTSQGTAEIDLESGTIPVLDPGQVIKDIERQQVAQAFEQYCRTKNHEIAAGCGIPYELLTADFSQVTFASARTALRAFQRMVLQAQRRLVTQLCMPVWGWFIDAAFESGALKDPAFPANRAEYMNVEWTPPRVEFVDPLKELQAYGYAVEKGFLARSMVIEELGYDPKVVDELRSRDKMAPPSTGSAGVLPQSVSAEDAGRLAFSNAWASLQYGESLHG